jgi:phosphoribosyl 1,2-cyclic phosphate phosphodiesterase
MRGLHIIDALRYKPHPTHLHIEKALEYIGRLEPRRAVLTHISHEISHEDASRNLPENVGLAYDGWKLEI